MDLTIRQAGRYKTREEKLRAMLRAAQITPEQLTLAAQCNDRDAAKIMEIEPIKELEKLVITLSKYLGIGPILYHLNEFLKTKEWNSLVHYHGGYSFNNLGFRWHTERATFTPTIANLLRHCPTTTVENLLETIQHLGKQTAFGRS